MGPERASETIRKALSMGADKAIHVVDDALHGSDAIQTSAALAAVLGSAPGSTSSSSARSRPTRGWACWPRCCPSGSASRS